MRYASMIAALTVGVAGLSVAGVQEAHAATSPVIVNHRGGGGLTPSESTPSALYKTYKSGITHIELDVWRNVKGEYFILHDSTLDRTTDCVGQAVTKSLDELAKCGVMSLGKALYLVRKYKFSLYLHVKNVEHSPDAKALTAYVTKRNKSGIRYIADNESTLVRLDKYVPNANLGLIVNRESEWSVTSYPELWYFGGPITIQLVREAQKRGQKVGIIQNVDALDNVDTIRQYGPDSIMVN